MATYSIISQLLTSLIILLFSNLAWTYFRSPLKSYPGPLLAKFTNLWRFFDVWGGRPELTQRMLHQKYGSAVQLGPDVISLSDPSLIKTIYNIKGNYLKTGFYSVNDLKAGKQIVSNMFGTRSNEFHAAQVKPVQKHYTMNSMKEMEPLVNRTVQMFIQRLDEEFVKSGKVCAMDDWLMYFAWDVISDLSYGQPMGFLEKAVDIDNILADAEKSLDYFATIGQMPQLDYWFDKNPVQRIGPPSFGAVVNLSVNRLVGRLQGKDGHDPSQKDFLAHFIEKKDQLDWVDDQQVIGWILINMLAGADTTAITIRAIVYYVLKNPIVYQRLRQELDSARLSHPISYDTTQTLSYLAAVIQEAMRIHPGVGLMLERVVPAEGLTIPDGRFIPGGTTVGMNAWVVHTNKEVFGQDAEIYNPSRWLPAEGESQESFQARRSRMKEADLTFGAGKRVCLGKNVSMMEAYKLIATMFLLYDMEFADPRKEWEVHNSWFVRQKGMDIKVKRRAM